MSKQKINVKNWITAIRTDNETVKEIYEKMEGMWNNPDLVAFEEHGIRKPLPTATTDETE
jgi:hypothetical protein